MTRKQWLNQMEVKDYVKETYGRVLTKEYLNQAVLRGKLEVRRVGPRYSLYHKASIDAWITGIRPMRRPAKKNEPAADPEPGVTAAG